MTAALVPLLRKSEIKSVVVISSIAATANQRSASYINPIRKADIRLVVHHPTSTLRADDSITLSNNASRSSITVGPRLLPTTIADEAGSRSE